LSSAERPSFTRDQKTFLKEITQVNFDAMSKAFGIITKLDTFQSELEFRKAHKLARKEFLDNGFLENNIFSVCARRHLLVQVGTEDNELMSELTERCDRYELTSGFKDCTFAIKYCVQNELPLKRQKQVVEIGQRIYELGTEAIAYGRSIIPDYIVKPDNLEKELESKNAEQWGNIFEGERFRPTMNKALAWKHTRVIFQQVEQNEFYRTTFAAALEEQFKECDLQTRPLEEDMLSDPDNKTSMQLDHHPSEIRQRELCQKLIECVDRVAQKLSHDLQPIHRSIRQGSERFHLQGRSAHLQHH